MDAETEGLLVRLAKLLPWIQEDCRRGCMNDPENCLLCYDRGWTVRHVRRQGIEDEMARQGWRRRSDVSAQSKDGTTYTIVEFLRSYPTDGYGTARGVGPLRTTTLAALRALEGE